MNHNSRPGLARLLLQSGADVNHRNRYGETLTHAAMTENQIGSIEVLMEFGADLTIRDANGQEPMTFFVRCGPEVIATVSRLLRNRNGEEAPMDEKRCDNCRQKGEMKLMICSKCRSSRYCSVGCQRTLKCLSILSPHTQCFFSSRQAHIGRRTNKPANLSHHPM